MSASVQSREAVLRSKRRAQVKRAISQVVFQIIVTAFASLFALPLIWLVLSSLKTNVELVRFPPTFFPERLIWSNWPRILREYPFGVWYRNTLFLAVNAAVGSMVSNTVVAYGFSRVKWRGRGLLFSLCLWTMLLPGVVTQIPVYIIWRRLSLLGTWYPLTLRAWLASPYYVFLMAQFFRTIPEELGDAARVDGCQEFGIFWRIFLPLCKPAIAVVGLFAFVGTWGDVLGPLIYVIKSEMYTLALGLQLMRDTAALRTPEGTDWAGMMAGTGLAALPVIAIFFFTQRVFIEGITFTGIKG